MARTGGSSGSRRSKLSTTYHCLASLEVGYLSKLDASDRAFLTGDMDGDHGAVLREMKICRFCLTERQPLSNMYEKDKKQSVPLPLQIMACVALEVFANDGMPQLICDDCRFQTSQSYAFKTMCKKSDDALKLFLATGILNKFKNDSAPEVQNCEKRCADDMSASPLAKRTKKEVIATQDEACEETVECNTVDDSTQTELMTDVESLMSEPTFEVREGASSPEETLVVKTIPKVVPTQCFPCTECERSFPLQQLLDIHMRQHTRERKFTCTKCDKRFFSKHDLAKHVQTHSGTKPFACIVCQKSFSRATLLHRHEKVHVTVPKYLCTYCDRTYLSSDDLTVHMAVHKKKRPFKCTQCDKCFAFKQGLERHETVHTAENPHKCNYCDASFTTPAKLARHVTSHAGARPFPCKLCPRTFLLSHHLTRHLRNHYDTKMTDPSGRHKCDVCSMSFRRKDLLIEHIAIHSMVSLKCVVCGRQFQSPSVVKEHVAVHFTGLPYSCDKCDYSFENQDELEEHEAKHAPCDSDDGSAADEDEPQHVRRSRRTTKIKNYADFLTSEIGTDSERESSTSEADEPKAVRSPGIRPVVRSETVRVYKGKEKPARSDEPEGTSSNAPAKPPETVKTLTKITTLENLGLPKSTLDVLSERSGFVEMKIGQKVIRVQKLMMTKSDVQAMAQQGKIEMRGSTTVVVKGPPGGTLDLNELTQLATCESAEPESDATTVRTPLRTYKKKPTGERGERGERNK